MVDCLLGVSLFFCGSVAYILFPSAEGKVPDEESGGRQVRVYVGVHAHYSTHSL